ncbi:MAG TPA: DUF2207 domain-containing protein [Terriglobales bacterium]|nr:DUF2207 domain-containing protein [Terriglobales bacterium]
MSPRSRRWLRLGALLALLAALCAPLAAQERAWRIADFESNVSVKPDGEIVVIESIHLVFLGHWNGIYRNIPIEYPGPNDTNYSLFLKVLQVTDENNQALKFEQRVENGERRLKIYIPGAEDNSKIVNIAYSVSNAVRFFPDHDEFYWNVTGNDWPVPIDHAGARVSFPPAAAGQLRAQAFTGVYGSVEGEALAKADGSDAIFETTNPLPMRGGLTVDVYVPKGILKEPSSLTHLLWFVRSNPIVLLPVAALLVMFGLWYWKGRDPDVGLSVAPMYEAPKDFTPAEVGTLVDDSIDPRDITCTIVDLAVRGYIKIEETRHEVLMFHSTEYNFRLLKSRDEWRDVTAHERTMLDKIFVGGQAGEVTALSSLRNQFYTAIPTIKDNILAQLRAKNVYSVDPNQANAWRLLGVALIAAPFILMQWLGGVQVFSSVWLAGVSIVAALLIVWLFGRQMSAKTLSGQKTYIQVLGFQEFMTRVDADRLRTMPPNTFEKCLPFAMALGVEHQWSKKFEGILNTPPSWYQGYGPGYTNFNPYLFTHSLGSMTNQAGETFVSAPRSSSSGSGFSGGGGGGFSGGGFGGGGGGAF